MGKKKFEITKASAYHGLKGDRDMRVAAAAVDSARAACAVMLRSLRRSLANVLKVSKRKTVSKEMLVGQLEFQCAAPSVLNAAMDSGKKRAKHSVAPDRAKRIFAQAGEVRMGADAKRSLGHLATAYLEEIGSVAGSYVRASKRKTVSAKDVDRALNQMSR